VVVAAITAAQEAHLVYLWFQQLVAELVLDQPITLLPEDLVAVGKVQNRLLPEFPDKAIPEVEALVVVAVEKEALVVIVVMVPEVLQEFPDGHQQHRQVMEGFTLVEELAEVARKATVPEVVVALVRVVVVKQGLVILALVAAEVVVVLPLMVAAVAAALLLSDTFIHQFKLEIFLYGSFC
jgi:hypothetical protein